MTWQNGRELATYADSAKSVAYSYDASGMRTGKTVTKSSGSTTAYSYVYENGLLLQMSRGARFYDFSYDANGRPLSIAYRSQAEATPIYYYYALNSRGDVIGLYNSSGNIAALYDYDAYGKLLSVKTATGISITAETDVAIVNPLRYRGYVYDTETGFYYLQSRYYDPTTCRFINADSLVATGQGILGYNMFAYCNNNPVTFSDPNGTDAIILYDDDSWTHIGALIEDENGSWWHFYWGTNTNSIGSALSIIGTKPVTWCELYEGGISLNSINEDMHYGASYDAQKYLVGDFSSTIDDFKNLDGSYNLISNNCSHVTLSTLAKADTSHTDLLNEASKKIVPRNAFKIINTYQPTYNAPRAYHKLTVMERRLHGQ